MSRDMTPEENERMKSETLELHREFLILAGLHDGNARMKEAAAKRGYKLHPKLANKS